MYWGVSVSSGFKETPFFFLFLNREEMLSISMDCSKGGGISSSGGVFKNSFNVHLPVTVVLIIIRGYFSGLMKGIQPVVLSGLFVRT